MNLDFPYRFDSRGRTADTSDEDHIRDLIEQVLFTAPGERVSDELAAATQFLVQGSLQQWLGDLIEVNEVDVHNEDSTLRITVQYIIRRTQQQQTAQFTRGGTI